MPCDSRLLEEVRRAFLEFDGEEVKRLVRLALESGCSPTDVIEGALRPAMEEVGRRFEEGEFFLAELVMAGDLFKEVMDDVLLPAMGGSGGGRRLGTVVLGTVRGDIHDIGKNIVAAMLRAAGFEVIDLGVDVPPERFVEAVKRYGADIVGMSALLTTTMHEMKNVIEALEKEGLRGRVKVVIGGAAVSREYAEKIGADGYAENAVEAVRLCKKLVGAE